MMVVPHQIETAVAANDLDLECTRLQLGHVARLADEFESRCLLRFDTELTDHFFVHAYARTFVGSPTLG